jgi:hypothetical protein
MKGIDTSQRSGEIDHSPMIALRADHRLGTIRRTPIGSMLTTPESCHVRRECHVIVRQPIGFCTAPEAGPPRRRLAP